jgi:hypothetical protein
MEGDQGDRYPTEKKRPQGRYQPNECGINKNCPEWNDGAGSGLCYKCRALHKTVTQHHHMTQPFYTSQEIVESAVADPKLSSIFSALRRFKGRDKALFLDHIYGMTLTDLALDYGLSKSYVCRVLKKISRRVKLEIMST